MATRGRPMGRLHQDDVRAKIQAGQLIKTLQEHALKGGEFEQTRLKAIEILLKKSLPDLTSVELVGADGGPIQIDEVKRPKLTKAEWLAAHGVGTAGGSAK